MTDPLAALEAWQAAGGKARSCGLSHDNGYGANPGWELDLLEGKRCVTVTGWDVMKANGGDEFGTLAEVIAEALRRWEEKT